MLTQQRTDKVFDWLNDRAGANQGNLFGYTNADIGGLLGFDDLSRHGRVLGNIQSRIDFACYQEGLPPLGLCVLEHFGNAWRQEGRTWPFPVATMQATARTYRWADDVLERVRIASRMLPGQAAISWRKELSEREAKVRQWAESLRAEHPAQTPSNNLDPDALGLAELERKLLGKKPELRARTRAC